MYSPGLIPNMSSHVPWKLTLPHGSRPVSTNQERLGKNLGRRWAGRFHGTARWHGEFDHLGAVPPCVYSHLLHTVGLSAAFIAKKIGLTFQRSFHDMLGLLGPKVDLVDFDIFRLRPWPRKGQKLYMVSFGLSLLWIGSFAFLLVWWTEIALRRNWVKLSETVSLTLCFLQNSEEAFCDVTLLR